MAGNLNPYANIDNIEVKVFGEKKGRYDLDNLPKLKYKKKDKLRHKRRSKATSASFSLTVNEPDVVNHSNTAIGLESLDENVEIVGHDCQSTSSVGTVTLQVVKFTRI